MQERSGDNWQGYLGGQCPVQGCGLVDGLPWYFRARGAAWSFEIADDATLDPEVLPIVGQGVPGWSIEEDYGVFPQASYMDLETAWSFIGRCIGQFRAAQLAYVESGSPP